MLKYWHENEKQEMRHSDASQQCLRILLSCFRAKMSGTSSPLRTTLPSAYLRCAEERKWAQKAKGMSVRSFGGVRPQKEAIKSALIQILKTGEENLLAATERRPCTRLRSRLPQTLSLSNGLDHQIGDYPTQLTY